MLFSICWWHSWRNDLDDISWMGRKHNHPCELHLSYGITIASCFEPPIFHWRCSPKRDAIWPNGGPPREVQFDPKKNISIYYFQFWGRDGVLWLRRLAPLEAWGGGGGPDPPPKFGKRWSGNPTRLPNHERLTKNPRRESKKHPYEFCLNTSSFPEVKIEQKRFWTSSGMSN